MSKVVEKKVYYICIGKKCLNYKIGPDEDGFLGSVYCDSYFAGKCTRPQMCKRKNKVKAKRKAK